MHCEMENPSSLKQRNQGKAPCALICKEQEASNYFQSKGALFYDLQFLLVSEKQGWGQQYQEQEQGGFHLLKPVKFLRTSVSTDLSLCRITSG